MPDKNTYPWNVWSDGLWRAAFPGMHYGVTADHFAEALSVYAQDSGNNVDVIRLADAAGVVFRFTAVHGTRDTPQDVEKLIRPLTAFIATQCSERESDWTLTDDLRTAFRAYLTQQGRPASLNTVAFGRALKRVSPGVTRTKKRMNGGLISVYCGITLNPSTTEAKEIQNVTNRKKALTLREQMDIARDVIADFEAEHGPGKVRWNVVNGPVEPPAPSVIEDGKRTFASLSIDPESMSRLTARMTECEEGWTQITCNDEEEAEFLFGSLASLTTHDRKMEAKLTPALILRFRFYRTA